MRTVKQYQGELIIQLGDIYNFGSSGEYRIIEKTSTLVNAWGDVVKADGMMCIVENIETGERKQIREKGLRDHLHEFNRVVVVDNLNKH